MTTKPLWQLMLEAREAAGADPLAQIAGELREISEWLEKREPEEWNPWADRAILDINSAATDALVAYANRSASTPTPDPSQITLTAAQSEAIQGILRDAKR